ncbi:hypothetical protein HY745_11090 [Candidatus Desantisbacteria bacterium]|nr:hypothetical protein [Candidatus Desantisbacteria bacterium]
MHKSLLIIFTILILSGCMGMMMHGTDHNHSAGQTSEVKTIVTPDTTADSASTGMLQHAPVKEAQKPHHEEISENKSVLTWGGVGMVLMMVIMMGRFIF